MPVGVHGFVLVDRAGQGLGDVAGQRDALCMRRMVQGQMLAYGRHLGFEQQVDGVLAPAFRHDIQNEVAQLGIRLLRARGRRLAQQRQQLRAQRQEPVLHATPTGDGFLRPPPARSGESAPACARTR